MCRKRRSAAGRPHAMHLQPCRVGSSSKFAKQHNRERLHKLVRATRSDTPESNPHADKIHRATMDTIPSVDDLQAVSSATRNRMQSSFLSPLLLRRLRHARTWCSCSSCIVLSEGLSASCWAQQVRAVHERKALAQSGAAVARPLRLADELLPLFRADGLYGVRLQSAKDIDSMTQVRLGAFTAPSSRD